MAQNFVVCDREQAYLMPPSLRDWLPGDQLAWCVIDVVAEMDLSAIYGDYRVDGHGRAAFDPAMMVALLLYAYSRGVYASRAIARSCEALLAPGADVGGRHGAERLDFMAVTALQRPDFRTISDFRKRHLAALAGLFAQVLALCREAGLVKLGHVALGGTKVQANASKHKEAELRAEVARWLEQAARIDAAEDAELGDRRGKLVLGPAQPDPWEMPAWLADKQKRLAKIR